MLLLQQDYQIVFVNRSCWWRIIILCLLFVSVPIFESLNDEVLNSIVDVVEEVRYYYSSPM